MTKQSVLVGPAYCVSGYGTHMRQIARILDTYSPHKFETTLRATVWGNTPFMLDNFEERAILDKMNSNNVHQREHFDYSFQVILPDEFKTDIADKNIGITAAVETHVCNPKWVDDCNKMDLMVVPSNFVKQTLSNSGTLTVPLEVVHETFPDYLLNKELECDLPFDFEPEFNFLHVGQLSGRNEEDDRKGIIKLIRLFCTAFQDNKNVGLVIKTNSARNTTIDRRATLGCLKEHIAKHRKGQYPKIYLIHGKMKVLDICKLYKHKKIKAFVTVCAGEGFGLPILESAAAGLPILATNWSAHTEFLSVAEKSFIKLNYQLVDIPQRKIDNRIFIPDAKWAQVIDDDVISKVRKVYESYSLPKLWAQNLQDLILTRYNFESMKSKFIAALDKHIGV